MADSQRSQTTETVVDAPPTETAPARLSLLDTLPGRLAEDTYVRYLATEADRARNEHVEERTAHRETRDRLLDMLQAGVKLEAERNNAVSELKGLKAKRVWTPSEVYLIVFITLTMVGFIIIPAIGQIVGA